MSNTIISVVFALIIGIIVGWFARPIPTITERVQIDTIYQLAPIITDTVKVPKYIKTVVKDKVNIDSLYSEALAYWEKTNPRPEQDTSSFLYTSQVDTVYSDGLLTAKIRFNSLLPLHPESYFDMDFRVREKIIYKTITKEKGPTFLDHFGVGVQAGYFYIPRTKQLDFGVGFGLSVNF